jgi:hypothetical protein
VCWIATRLVQEAHAVLDAVKALLLNRDQDLSTAHDSGRPIMSHVYTEMIITHLFYLPPPEQMTPLRHPNNPGKNRDRLIVYEKPLHAQG